MHVLSIVTSPRKERSASRTLVDAFFREYMARAENIAVDILNVFNPSQADLFSHNALLINASCQRIWGHIVDATKWPPCDSETLAAAILQR
jgi:FMN-dependent NADH-azoreductase